MGEYVRASMEKGCLVCVPVCLKLEQLCGGRQVLCMAVT